jgi:hypothetical protein
MIRPVVKKDILSVLKKSLVAIKNNDLVKLRDQSFHTVHNSSIYQDEYSISVSVVIYSLYKVLEKEKEYFNLNSFKSLLSLELKKSIHYLEREDMKLYSASLKKIISSLTKLDKNVNHYISDVMESTKVKKASNIHSHGLSVGKAAELLGLTKWELMPYFGQTRTYDNKYNMSKKVEERILFARRVFGVK